MKDKQDFILYLYHCLSGSEKTPGGQIKKSIARKISEVHKKSIIVGFDGFAIYNNINGVPQITGISDNLTELNNKGKAVVYVNGNEVARLSYEQFILFRNSRQ